MANLVIIESPTKATNLKSYLGSNYKVMASVGHVRDLPKSSLGVDIEKNFAPHFINIRGKGDLIKDLEKEAKKASTVYLATDPDREGEAIAWHLCSALHLDMSKTKRITFNEVTKTAVKAAIKKPREIDMQLVDSQVARRVLDRIVGYKLSPYLWKAVRSGISAGRVQSVATRIIVEREEEIKNFVPKEYWTITVLLENEEKQSFTARFYGIGDKKKELTSESDAMEVVGTVNHSSFTVKSVKKSVKMRNPAPPFTTSSLQQDANRKLGFPSAKTMKVAQELYEGINLGSNNGGVSGLITYMRTDSVRISDEAALSAEKYIKNTFGDAFYPETRRIYKTKKNAQDAHEAIRPVDIEKLPDQIKDRLSADQYRLYKLIWSRFTASQMASARFDTVSSDIDADVYRFKSTGSALRFPGYLTVYEDATENDGEENKGMLPDLTENQVLNANQIAPEQHFTEPPARFNEGSLVKFLEEKGIGRPSTFATIVTTIIQRSYVAREGKSLVPTELGNITTKLMKENFSDIVDYGFTAQMEEKLDSIEHGETDMVKLMTEFYGPFEEHLEKAMMGAEGEKIVAPPEETDIICEKCGARMVVKNGRFGKFAACPNYPECKNTKPLAKDGKTLKPEKAVEIMEGMKCEKCGGDMVIRQGRYGIFYACINYPKCKFTKQPTKELDIPCPKCGKPLVSKRGRNKSIFYSCSSYPECDFSTWDLPTKEKCPKCGEMLFVKKSKNLLVCHNKECNYQREAPEKEIPEAKENE